MANRLDLHEVLCNILGSKNVYYDPPESVKMRYPAIRYSRDDFDDKHANNGIYMSKTRYSIIVITDDPDSELIEEVKALPYCGYDRHYTSDNLHHDVFTIYY